MNALTVILLLIIIVAVVYLRRDKQKKAKKLETHMPDAFLRVVSDEYRAFFDAEPPEEFVQAVYDEYQGWDENLRKGMKKSAESPSGKEYDWKTEERWEDYPVPDYDKVHTYCSVVFEEGGPSFYYRTRNPELKVGDKVYVPVGYRYEKKVGRIVKMKNYRGHHAPYPLEKTKYIIGKV